MKNTLKQTKTLTELSINQAKKVAGGSDTVNGKVKLTADPIPYSETVTGKVK